MRVLITGFEPFGGDDINSSWETASRIGMQSFEGVEVVARQLPVSFRRVGKAVEALLDKFAPDVLIMLGQAGSSNSVRVERVAINMMDSKKGDNDGYAPDEEMIEVAAMPAYFSNLSVKRLRDILLENRIPATVSNSAGLYVCNRTYYAALHRISESKMETKVVFVHLPRISEEWSVDRLQQAIEIITIGLCVNP